MAGVNSGTVRRTGWYRLVQHTRKPSRMIWMLVQSYRRPDGTDRKGMESGAGCYSLSVLLLRNCHALARVEYGE